MKRINLSGDDWRLIYVKNKQYVTDGECTDAVKLRARGYNDIPATVPGNLEIDLMRAGVIDDPFYADNHKKRDCEYLHAFYVKKFFVTEEMESPCLEFLGIDTVADVYLNGILVAKTDNMFISHTIPVEGALKIGGNELVVHIRPAVIEARKYKLTSNESAAPYNRESLYIRKAPHMYGWDIMPRIVSLGIWKPVSLVETKRERITEFYAYTTKCSEREAVLRFNLSCIIENDECMDYSVEIRGKCADSEFSYTSPLYHTSVEDGIKVSSPCLWWPRNYGEQNLYDVTVTLNYMGAVIDEYNTTLGIRTVELVRSSVMEADGDGDFYFKVNGKRVFITGTNWVPVDALHSRDKERLPSILPMICDVNCNAIRIWGGNVYEDDMLYDYCDREGILIWQDFMMGCASYPLTDDFISRLSVEIEWAVKKLRQHPSILAFAGDNENDIAYTWRKQLGRNPNMNRLTREVIPNILHQHDYTRPYIPSSPYIDEAAYNSGKKLSEDHLWGPRNYFKGDFYRGSVCAFASETGYHGCTSPKSIEKYIPKEYLFTSETSDGWTGLDNDMWMYHAASPEIPSNYTYRIMLMAKQVSVLFGKSVPNTLEDFAKASQISQAEANKYFIEKFRIGRGDKVDGKIPSGRRSGLIWWNLIDGWPQFSDAVVDYYGVKKLAYSYIKRSQEPVCMMFDDPKDNMLPLILCSEGRASEVKYRVTNLTESKTVAEGTATADADASVRVELIPIKEGEKNFYLIEWEISGVRYTNHYVTNIRDLDYKEYLSYLEKCGYDCFEGF